MKQVWMLNHYAQEPGYAGGTRHFSIAKNLRELGWNTSIIASSIELNSGRQRLKDGEHRRVDIVDSVPFLWIRTPAYSGNGIGRLLNMLVYSIRVLLPKSTQMLEAPDLIIGSSVHPLAVWSASRLAAKFSVPFVFEVRDLWPQTLIDLGRLRESSLATSYLRWLEKRLYHRAASIIVLLPRAADYIVPLGISASKIRWIPNGVEINDDFCSVPEQSDRPFVFMYFGAHGVANGLETVLYAMREMSNGSNPAYVCLRLIGAGSEKSRLVNLASELNLANVIFEDPVPKNDIPALASEADGFVFNLVNAPVFRFGISSNKLFDYLAAARPIVFSCEAANNPVAESGAGLTVEPGEPKKLAVAMMRIARTPLLERIEMGRAGRRYVIEKHDYRVLAKQFATALDDVVRQAGSAGRV